MSLAGFFGLVITSYLISGRGGDVGATSEITAILAFLLGGLAFQGQLLLAAGLAVLMALLLSFKLPLHRFVKTPTKQDVRAIIEFVIISALVLPYLPNTGYGPHGSFNPKEIWTMVILVSGIGLAGYLLSKVMGVARARCGRESSGDWCPARRWRSPSPGGHVRAVAPSPSWH